MRILFKCAECGAECDLQKELDKKDSDWDYYEDQHEDFVGGHYIKHMKITHSLPWCGTVNLVKVKFVATEIEVEGENMSWRQAPVDKLAQSIRDCADEIEGLVEEKDREIKELETEVEKLEKDIENLENEVSRLREIANALGFD